MVEEFICKNGLKVSGKRIGIISVYFYICKYLCNFTIQAFQVIQEKNTYKCLLPCHQCSQNFSKVSALRLNHSYRMHAVNSESIDIKYLFDRPHTDALDVFFKNKRTGFALLSTTKRSTTPMWISIFCCQNIFPCIGSVLLIKYVKPCNMVSAYITSEGYA